MPKKQTYHKFFSVYLAQEVDESIQGEARLECPFEDCKKEDHFYASMEEGQWHCKRCDRSGNARILITELHKQFLEETTDSQYNSLSAVRGISIETLRDVAQFAYDANQDRWLVPYFTYLPEQDEWSEYLNNLGYFYPSSKKEKTRYKIKKAPVLPLYLYQVKATETPKGRAAINEGEWDALAYFEASPDTQEMIVGKPGAGFNVSYLKTFKKIPEVHLLLDNDDAGRKQTASSIKVIESEISNISVLDWTLVERPQKDIRDLWMEEADETAGLIEAAMIPYTEGEDTSIKDNKESYQTDIAIYPPVPSFTSYIEKAKERLYLTDETVLSMAAVLGITRSIEIPGEPLWAFLIGPPSSGKTTFIDSFGGNNKLFDNLSKISAKSLVSGWKDESGDEPSYLAKLRDKSLFVKDFTVTLTDSPDSQREVFGLLTDIFDGYIKIPYGNNEIREFHDLYFNMIAGVTDIVHKHSAASIGERFLRIDYLGKDYNSREFARRALLNFGQSKDQRQSLVENTLGFVNHINSVPLKLEIEDQYIDPITDLAEFIATVRTKVESDHKEGISYRPRAELPSRLAFQLGKLFVSSRPVFQESDRDEDMEIAGKNSFTAMQKVALDTCYGFAFDIIKYINEHPYANRTDIANGTGIHTQKAYRVITDLTTTGAITTTSGRVGSKGGRPPSHYAVNPKIKAVIDVDKNIKKRRKPGRPPRRPRSK